MPNVMVALPNIGGFFGPFFRDYPGELVPEEIFFWTLWCKPVRGDIIIIIIQ